MNTGYRNIRTGFAADTWQTLYPQEERGNYLLHFEKAYSLQTGAEPEPDRIKLLNLSRINHINLSWTWSRTNLINHIPSLMINLVKPDCVNMNFLIIDLNKYVKL
jgi:hypothetical protein